MHDSTTDGTSIATALAIIHNRTLLAWQRVQAQNSKLERRPLRLVLYMRRWANEGVGHALLRP